MLLGITAGKRTRSCCFISQNRSQVSALPLGPGNLFNPAFLCRELHWGGHREKEDEGERRNTCLFLKGKATFGKNIVPQEAQLFNARADPAKSFSVNLRNAFLPHLARSAGIFCFSSTCSLFFTAQKKSFLFSLARAFTTSCHPIFHLYCK